MAIHAKPKPAPYSIAIGAIAYSLAATFHKNLPIEIIAGAPAAITAVAASFEADLAKVLNAVDPALATKVDAFVDPKVNRLAAQASSAAAQVEAGLATIGPA
jgi:hypothetical protein